MLKLIHTLLPAIKALYSFVEDPDRMPAQPEAINGGCPCSHLCSGPLRLLGLFFDERSKSLQHLSRFRIMRNDH